jgi:hypothetical protein
VEKSQSKPKEQPNKRCAILGWRSNSPIANASSSNKFSGGSKNVEIRLELNQDIEFTFFNEICDKQQSC